MNIMLVSVTERIREIGLRKALGGRPRAIRRQFLVEASILGLAGGVLGVGVGLLGARVLPHVTDARVIVSVPSAVIAVVMAIAIGVLFGVYPASARRPAGADRRPEERVMATRRFPVDALTVAPPGGAGASAAAAFALGRRRRGRRRRRRDRGRDVAR